MRVRREPERRALDLAKMLITKYAPEAKLNDREISRMKTNVKKEILERRGGDLIDEETIKALPETWFKELVDELTDSSQKKLQMYRKLFAPTCEAKSTIGRKTSTI